jgi:hypothetical protein
MNQDLVLFKWTVNPWILVAVSVALVATCLIVVVVTASHRRERESD